MSSQRDSRDCRGASRIKTGRPGNRMLSNRYVRSLMIVLAIVMLVEGGAALFLALAQSRLQAVGLVWKPDLVEARNRWRLDSSQVDEQIGGLTATGSKENSQ